MPNWMRATWRRGRRRSGAWPSGGWRASARCGPPEPLSPVRGATREAALAAARRVDPQADPTQIQPTETAITLLYYWGTAQANGLLRIHTTGPGDTSINSGRSKNGP